jgi:hypothetical protein
MKGGKMKNEIIRVLKVYVEIIKIIFWPVLIVLAAVALFQRQAQVQSQPNETTYAEHNYEYSKIPINRDVSSEYRSDPLVRFVGRVVVRPFCDNIYGNQLKPTVATSLKNSRKFLKKPKSIIVKRCLSRIVKPLVKSLKGVKIRLH